MAMFRALIAACFLAACATSANYAAILDTWVGAPESELVTANGPPASVYVAPDGTRILTYANTGSMTLPGAAPSYRSTVAGNTIYSTPSGGYSAVNVSLNCTTNFTVTNGIISSWRFEGNNCLA